MILKFTLRFLQSLVYLPLHFLMMVVCWILSPLLPLFVNEEGYLPRYLSWFQTDDNPMTGEGQFDHLPRYWQIVRWAMRNPAYGFAWNVLAANIPEDEIFKVYGDIYAKENPFKSGWTFIITKEGYFCFRLFLPTFKGKCLKARYGWKLRGRAINYPSHTTRCKYVITFNPFKKSTM